MNTEPTIGRFPVISQIGRGSFGSVYLAYDPNMGTAATARVAIKVLHENRLNYREGFLREAQLMRQLNCPGVVTVHEYDEYRDPRTGLTLPFFVMEYCERGTVATRLAELGRPITMEEGIGLVEAISASARTLALPRPGHPHGVVHRDLKPTNLLLQRVEDRHRLPVGELFRADEQLILGDFSIAKSVDPDARNMTLSGGTPGWGAPEQFFRDGPDESSLSPRADVDPSVDVYAASATVVAAMSNPARDAGIAFNDDDFAATGPLETELRRAMSADPAQRHRDFDQWRDALVAASAGPAEQLTTAAGAGTPAESEIETEPTAETVESRAVESEASEADAGLSAAAGPARETRPADGFVGAMETVRGQRHDGMVDGQETTPYTPSRSRAPLFVGIAAGVLALVAIGAFAVSRIGGSESTAAGDDVTDTSAIIESVAAPESVDEPTTVTTVETTATTTSATSATSTTATSTTVAEDTSPTTDTTVPTTVAATGTPTTPTTEPPAPTGSAVVGLAGLCLDVPNQNFRAGQNLWMWPCNDSEAQQWSVDGNSLTVAGFCLDIEGPSIEPGAALQIWPCEDVPQHRWRIVGDTIVSDWTGLCVEVAFADPSAGANVWTAECNGSAEQRWTVQT